MTTTVNTARTGLTIGPIDKMFSTLFPAILSEETMKLAANTRFAHEWEKVKKDWGTDADSLAMAAEELMNMGILQPFPFDLEAQFEIDQERERLGIAEALSATFLEMISNVYSDLMVNSGKEAGELCMSLQIEETKAVELHIKEALNPVEDIIRDNIDSEGPVDISEIASVEGGVEVDTFSKSLPEKNLLQQQEMDSVISEKSDIGTTELVDLHETDASDDKTHIDIETKAIETSEAKQKLDTSNWDQLLAKQLVQDPTELAIDSPTTTEAAKVETTVYMDKSSQPGSMSTNSNTRTNEVDNDPTSELDSRSLVDKYQDELLVIFNSPITATSVGEIKLELQDASTHDFETRIMELGAEPRIQLYLSVNARITTLRELLDSKIEEAAETSRLEIVALLEEQKVTVPVETLELNKPYEVAGFKSQEAWLASFNKKETKVVKMTSLVDSTELNTGGKYTSGKGGNRPIEKLAMTEKQSAMAAKNLYKHSKKSTNLKGMNSALKAVFSTNSYEAATLGTCKVGEKINIFPNTLLPNQLIKTGKEKNAKMNAINIGTAFFSKDFQAYGFGMHWRNFPCAEQGTMPDFIWPTMDVTFKFERKGKDNNNETVWFKDSASIPVPLIIEGSFGHAEQNKSGKRATACLKTTNPKCFRPTITAASPNNLVKMANLGYTYLGTTEVTRGREFMEYGITGMRLHVFLSPKQQPKFLNDLIEDGSLANY